MISLADYKDNNDFFYFLFLTIIHMQKLMKVK
jgi:hypothetical protein